jgi:hypothetical protein
MVVIEPLSIASNRPGDGGPFTTALLRFVDLEEQTKNLETSFGVASELAAMLCLATGRRLEVAREIKVRAAGRDAVSFLGYSPTVDRTLMGPPRPDSGVRFLDWLSRVPSLNDEDRNTLGAASQLHYGSVLLCHSDIRSAYVLLVGALEMLSRRYSMPASDWFSWEDHEEWEALFEREAMTSQQRQAIRAQLLRNRHLRLKLTFRNYVVGSLPESFWDQPWQEWMHSYDLLAGKWQSATQSADLHVADLIPRDRTILSKALARTYDLRSGLLHRGEDLKVFATSIPSGFRLTGSTAVPYSLLRSILAALVEHEFLRVSVPSPLPDIHYT